MTDFGEVWMFTRFRLKQALEDLTDEQVRWKQHENAHTIVEYLYHIAGAEHYWTARLLRRDPSSTDLDRKLDCAIMDGFLREGDCPFTEEDLTKAKAEEALSYTFNQLKPLYEHPRTEVLQMQLTSPIGDQVTGRQGLIRLAQHAGYHTGQIWLLKQDPRFP